jgi:hypothetical protein
MFYNNLPLCEQETRTLEALVKASATPEGRAKIQAILDQRTPK